MAKTGLGIKGLSGGRSARRRPGSGAAEARFLVQALRNRRVDGATAVCLPGLASAAASHGVVLPLYRALGRGTGNGDLELLAASASYRRAVALQIGVASLEVSDWLRQSGVVHAVLKGPAVAAAYPNADREFVDLDVLVAPAEMPRAIGALERHGAGLDDAQGWPRSDGITQIGLSLPSGVTIDLHADVIHVERARRDFRIAVEPLLARVTTTEVLGRPLPVLDAEDNLTHVALHAMLSGGDRLMWLADLDALVRSGRIRWPVLVERARQARVALVVGVMLQRASIVLGTPVPADALAALLRRGRVWARVLAAFERRRPTASNHDRNLHGQVLVRATRSSTWQSALTLAGLIWTDVILLLVNNPEHPWRRAMRRRRRP